MEDRVDPMQRGPWHAGRGRDREAAPRPTRITSEPDEPGPGTADGEQSRLDRELIELLNELRVALPGVQVLFAFLLTVPFTQRFGDLSALQRDVYFAILVTAALATALLMSPTAFHRLRFRQRDKNALLKVGNRMAIAGLVLLSLAMSGAVFLIGDVIFGRTASVAVACGVAAAFAGVWYVLPLVRRGKDSAVTEGRRAP